MIGLHFLNQEGQLRVASGSCHSGNENTNPTPLDAVVSFMGYLQGVQCMT